MYENLIGLAFTNAYVGVVTTNIAVPDAVYQQIAASPSDSVRASYFDYADVPGALWIAEAGKHAEPIVAWLSAAQKKIDCTTMLAAVISNGAVLPPTGDCYTFTVARTRLDDREMQRFRKLSQFICYLPYTDEFRFVVQEIDQWTAVRRVLDAQPCQYFEITRRSDVPEGTLDQRPSSSAGYDPIAAQVKEVMLSMSGAALAAVGTLTDAWKEVWPPVPPDVEGLTFEISEEQERISAELKVVPERSAERDAVLADIDRYAYLVSRIHHVASDLESKLLALDLSARNRRTYEEVATPMMLHAVERYATDIAHRLGLTEYAFVPVIGSEFAVRPKLFPPIEEATTLTPRGPFAAIVEIPAEIRLRLGALPMIAREIAWLLEDDLDRISNRLQEMEQRDPWVTTFLPRRPQSPRTPPEALQRHKEVTLQCAREMAADLIAAAVAGPQYVFAMARFAVGTLSQSEHRGFRNGQRLQLRRRLSACLALLRTLGAPAEFTSIYLPENEVTLPKDLVDLVCAIPSCDGASLADDVAEVTHGLTRGCVVRARPRVILATLWRECVRRGAYVNEQAALVSVAASQIP